MSATNCGWCGAPLTVAQQRKGKFCSRSCGAQRLPRSLADIFWEKVNKSGGCWLWTAGKNEDGYGLQKVGSRCQLAHRVAWTMANGEIPDGLHVLHRCDVPACVNVEHLFLGTNQDNIADRVAKGRSHRMPGELAPRSRLARTDVLEIRLRLAFGSKRSELARFYGVTYSTIESIDKRRSWK